MVPATPSAINETTNMIKRAATTGGQIALAQEAESTLLLFMKQVLGARYAVLEGMVGENGIRLIAPILVHYLANAFPGVVPKSDMVSKACELATVGNVKDTLMPILKQVEPMILQLAKIGEQSVQGK